MAGMNRIQLSKNFYLDEFTRSETAARHGIEMQVPEDSEVFRNLKRLCQRILQPVRDALGPVHILSGYRPPELNKLLGGSPTSQHCAGLAGDFVVTGHMPLEVAQWIARHPFSSYDQLIHEFGQWVHVSVPYEHLPHRRELLTAFKAPGRKTTCYVHGIHPIDVATRLAFPEEVH